MSADDFSLRKSEEIVANALKSLSQISALIREGATALEEDEGEAPSESGDTESDPELDD